MPCRRAASSCWQARAASTSRTRSHSNFASRYGARRPQIEPLLRQFDARALREWAQGLGIATFVGTSGRVFPTDMKAAAIARMAATVAGAGAIPYAASLHWLDAAGRLRFESPQGERLLSPRPPSWPWEAASWPAWAPTARGCRCWNSAA